MNLFRPPLRLASKVARPTQRLVSNFLHQGLRPPPPRAASVEPKPIVNDIYPVRSTNRAARPQSSNLRRAQAEPSILSRQPEPYRAPIASAPRERSHSSFMLRMKKLEIALDADLKYREKLQVPEGFFSPKSVPARKTSYHSLVNFRG